mgnify:CR=1 FL=1
MFSEHSLPDLMPVEASPLILASNSPRRKQLMAAGGWSFEVLAAEVGDLLAQAGGGERVEQIGRAHV